MSTTASVARREGLTCAEVTKLLGRSRGFTERLARIRTVETFQSPSGRLLYDKASVEAVAGALAAESRGTSSQ